MTIQRYHPKLTRPQKAPDPLAPLARALARRRLTFDVAGVSLTAEVTPGTIVFDGRRMLGQYRRSECAIFISGHCHPSQRLQTLAHELAHAWLIACGHGGGDDIPTTVEGMCDFTATVAGAMVRDLIAEGLLVPACGEGEVGHVAQ